MMPSLGPAAARVAAVIPAALLVLLIGVLWLLGLACDKDRRSYVTTISEQAMGAIQVLMRI
jgi:hypothetical protein